MPMRRLPPLRLKSIRFGNFAKADKSYAVGAILILNTEYLAAAGPPRLARQVVPPALRLRQSAPNSSIDQGGGKRLRAFNGSPSCRAAFGRRDAAHVALGQKRTCAVQYAMSALHPKAD